MLFAPKSGSILGAIGIFIPFTKIHPTAPNIRRVGKKFYPPYHI